MEFKKTWFEVDITLNKSQKLVDKIIALVRIKDDFFDFALKNNIFDGLDLGLKQEREELEEYAKLLIRDNSGEELKDTLAAINRIEELELKYERFFEKINTNSQEESKKEIGEEVEDISSAIKFSLDDFDDQNQAIQ